MMDELEACGYSEDGVFKRARLAGAATMRPSTILSGSLSFHLFLRARMIQFTVFSVRSVINTLAVAIKVLLM